MWSTHLNIFAHAIKFRIFVPNFKISFIVFLYLVWHCVSNLCSLYYIMLRHAPLGEIWCSSNSGSRDPDSVVFIQCVNGWDPMHNESRYPGLNGIYRKVHPTVWVEIPTGTVVEFITKYLTGDGWRNNIIGEDSINGSVQFIGLSVL